MPAERLISEYGARGALPRRSRAELMAVDQTSHPLPRVGLARQIVTHPLDQTAAPVTAAPRA